MVKYFKGPEEPGLGWGDVYLEKGDVYLKVGRDVMVINSEEVREIYEAVVRAEKQIEYEKLGGGKNLRVVKRDGNPSFLGEHGYSLGAGLSRTCDWARGGIWESLVRV